MKHKERETLPRVNVLLSAYNGEKYITEQVDSIVRQDYPNLEIYIRDDGSSDRTLDLLKACKKENSKGRNIHIYSGKNVGYGPSFLWLLRRSSQGDYWAFCDQDDVWMEDKIRRGVSWMEEQKDRKESALLYHSAFLETDERLSVKGIYLPEDRDSYCFQKAITECMHMGFSSLLNRKLRELAVRGPVREIVSHDWWVELIVMEFGRACFDPIPSSFHRRLDSSQSSRALSARAKWVFKALTKESEIRNLTRAFMSVFREDMSKEDRDLLALFSPPYTFSKALKKSGYPARWRTSLSSELVLRMLMLLGRI